MQETETSYEQQFAEWLNSKKRTQLYSPISSPIEQKKCSRRNQNKFYLNNFLTIKYLQNTISTH